MDHPRSEDSGEHPCSTDQPRNPEDCQFIDRITLFDHSRPDRGYRASIAAIESIVTVSPDEPRLQGRLQPGNVQVVSSRSTAKEHNFKTPTKQVESCQQAPRECPLRQKSWENSTFRFRAKSLRKSRHYFPITKRHNFVMNQNAPKPALFRNVPILGARAKK
jgi:hypothetical protein